MNAKLWNARARLFRHEGRAGELLPRAHPVLEASLAAVVRHLQQQPSNELWRFSAETSRNPDMSAADLRALMARDDIPDAE